MYKYKILPLTFFKDLYTLKAELLEMDTFTS